MNESALQLAQLAESRSSGEFVYKDRGAEVHLYLREGRIVWGTDSRNPTAFSRCLKETAHVDDDSLAAVIAEARQSNAPVSDTLVAWNLATPDQVRAALRRQIAPAVALVEQSSPEAKAVFLSATQSSRFSSGLSIDVRECLTSAATLQLYRASMGRAAAASGPKPAQSGPRPGPPPGGNGGHPLPPRTEAKSAPAEAPPRRWRAGLWAGGGLVLLLLLIGLALLARRPGSTSAPSPALTASAPESTVNGVSATEVVLGMPAHFSGSGKDLSRGMRVGIETAFSAANAGGGVAGRRLRLVALDDGYDPARRVEVLRDLVETRKVFGIVGGVGSASAKASVPYLMEKKVLFFAPLSGSPVLRKRPPDRYVFNYRPSYGEETAAAVRYLVGVRRIAPAQIAVLYQADEFGQAGLMGFEEQVEKLGHDLAQVVRTTYRRGSADVSQAVERLRAEGARIRAVVMVADCEPATQFIIRMKDLRPDLVFTNVSAVEPNTLSEELVSAGKGYTSNVIVTQIVPHPMSKATAALEYQAALAKYAPGEKPGFVSFEGYIVGNLLLEGLRRAGQDLNTESLVAGLEDVRDLDLGIGTPISFGPDNHEASHKVWGALLQADGSYAPLKLE